MKPSSRFSATANVCCEWSPAAVPMTCLLRVIFDSSKIPGEIVDLLVFNEKTYPNLIALFAMLGVDSVETEMSFAVSLENPDIEWSGSNLATVFGQKRNLVRPQFWAMLSDILRFNRESVAWLLSHPDNQRSLRDFLHEGRYSPAFSEWYLLPMAAAIWSCPTGTMLGFPTGSFVRFFANHDAPINREKKKSVCQMPRRCRYAEMYREMGLGHIGHLLSCNRDGVFCTGYDPRIKLERTQTLMQGATHCDFRYRFETEDQLASE